MIAEIILLLKAGLSGSSEGNMTHKNTVRLVSAFQFQKMKPYHKRAAIRTVSRRGRQRDYIGQDYETSGIGWNPGLSWADIIGAVPSPEAVKAQKDLVARRESLKADALKSDENLVVNLSQAEKDRIKLAGISGLAFLSVKSWAKTPDSSQFIGWSIRKNGVVDTKWTDLSSDINDWFGNLGIGANSDVIYGAYWDKSHKDSTGGFIPVDEFSAPGITQAIIDDAIDAALNPKKKSSGAGVGLAVAAVGSVFAFAALKSKKR